MVVVYYTSAHFLDVAIETIQAIKNRTELHVVIEITPLSKKSTIINVDRLDHLRDIEDGETVLGMEQWKALGKYFSGVKSVRFLVHKNPKSLSYGSYRISRKFGKYIMDLTPDVVHFDTVTTRCIGLYRYIRSRKIFITIHDPEPHSGEFSWKKKIPNFLYFRLASGYFFYSQYARDQFLKNYKEIVAPAYVIRFQPVTYLAQFLKELTEVEDYVLFFGRLSPYKGIDLLLNAIPAVLEKFPTQRFVIAGAPDFNYELDMQKINAFRHNIELISKYLTTEELIVLLQKAKFVVCPYRDATQSGVLMTSFAAGKTVIATNVGGFPEYIENNVNGILSEPNAVDIAAAIVSALENNRYRELESKVGRTYSPVVSEDNRRCILAAYEREPDAQYR